MTKGDSLWPETRWSLISRAKGGREPGQAASAWEDLIRLYHEPIARVLRGYLRGAPNADEAAAVFFGYLYENEVMAKPSADLGRFRAYIQAVAKNFARRWRDRAQRDAVVEFVHDDLEQAEPDHEAWAPTLVERSLATLREKDAELIRDFYGIDRESPLRGEQLAARLGVGIDALYQRLHGARLRLRSALGEVLAELAATEAAWSAEMTWVDELLAEHYPAPGQGLGR